MVVVVGRIYLYLLFFSLSFSLVSEGENGGEGGLGSIIASVCLSMA